MKVNKRKTATSTGKILRFYRDRAGKSQLELTIDAELSPGTVSKIESNSVQPTIETLHKLGEALNLTSKELSYLLGVNLYIGSKSYN